MIFEIIGGLFILVIGGFGVRFALKKLKKDDLKNISEYDKEFEEGKVLLPIDKRDFEDLDEFKEKTKDIPKIQDKLESLNQDFKDLKFVTEKKDIDGDKDGK